MATVSAEKFVVGVRIRIVFRAPKIVNDVAVNIASNIQCRIVSRVRFPISNQTNILSVLGLGSERTVKSIARLTFIHIEVVIAAQEVAGRVVCSSGIRSISNRCFTLPQVEIYTSSETLLLAGGRTGVVVNICDRSCVHVENIPEIALLDVVDIWIGRTWIRLNNSVAALRSALTGAPNLGASVSHTLPLGFNRAKG